MLILSRWSRIKLWLARQLLRSTEHVAVPVEEVNSVIELCDELMEHAIRSGALPARLHIRKHIKTNLVGLIKVTDRWAEALP